MAGTVIQSITDIGQIIEGIKNIFRVVTFTCVGDVSAGTIPDTPTTDAITAKIIGMYLLKAQIIPGTPAPTANSDVAINDANGIDMLGGNGTDQLDASGAKEAYPMINTKGGSQPVLGPLTLAVSNNTGAGNQFVIKAVFGMGPAPVAGLT